MNKSTFLKLLRVKPEETKIAFYSFLFAFFIGVAQNVLFSVPLAMFLARYNSSFLPYIYVATGLSIFGMGMVFSYLERKVSVFYVLALPIALFSASLFLFWGLLFVIKTPLIFSILLVWSLLIVSLIISIVMLLINQLFTFQQSKRLYGLIVVGVALGGIIIGFGMDFLVKALGSNHLILLSSLILLCAFMIQFLIRKHSGGRLLHIEESGEAKPSKVSLKSFKDRNYILFAFLFTCIVYFIFYIFDLLLNTVVQQHFPKEEEMAAFYGVLYAVYDIAALFAGFVLSGWILTRFGLITSLLLLPVGLAMFLSVTFFANLIPSLAWIVFSFILISAVFEATVRECMTEQSILLLFQPLRPAQRAWTQIKNEAFIIPLATIAIGVILVALEKYATLKLSILIPCIIGLSLCGIAVIVFKLKGGYLKLLDDSLSKRSITNPRFVKLSKDSLVVLKSHLMSQYPDEVIYVLQTLEKIDQKEFVKALLGSLEHPLGEVRSFSLGKIDQNQVKAALDQVKQICLSEKDPVVLGPAILALGAISDLEQFPWFRNYLEDPNIEIVSSCLIALIRSGSEAEKKEASELINVKAKSPKEEDRLTAAKALKHVNIPIKADLLLGFLKDSSLEVRVAAAEAAANTADERLYSVLIENLEVPHVHDSALKSLISFGKPLFENIIKHFSGYSPSMQINLVKLLGFIKDEKSSEFLEKLLPISNRRLLYAVLSSLKKHVYKAADDQKYQMIERLLESKNKNIVFLKEMARFFGAANTRLLHDFLCREIELSQECCFSLLSFIYPEGAILKAQQGLTLEDDDMNSNAVELLLQTLEKHDQKLLMEQLIYAPYKEELEEVPSSEKIEQVLLRIKEYASDCFIPALSAAVIYEIGVLKIKNLAGLLLKLELEEDPLLKENILLSLKRLEA